LSKMASEGSGWLGILLPASVLSDETILTYQKRFERNHGGLTDRSKKSLAFLDAFHLVKGEGPPGEGKLIVVPRCLTESDKFDWTLLEVASLPVLDVWRVKDTSTKKITMEWLGPIGLADATRNIVRPPEVVEINPPRLMREFWTPKEGLVDVVASQAKTARDALPGTASSATVTRRLMGTVVVDPPSSESQGERSVRSTGVVDPLQVSRRGRGRDGVEELWTPLQELRRGRGWDWAQELWTPLQVSRRGRGGSGKFE
jgi:hypothetical protein